MPSPPANDDLAVEAERLRRAGESQPNEQYVLSLYVAGTTPRSQRAIVNIRRLCEEHLQGRYSLDVVDIYQQPGIATAEQIIAAPTLIKRLPMPLRRIIGDLSHTEKVLVGLQIQSVSRDGDGSRDPQPPL